MESPSWKLWVRIILTEVILLAITKETHSGPNEKRLLEEIFINRKYNTLERPIANESETLDVFFGLTLQQIIDVDEKNQNIKSNIWLNLAWHDYNLAWNESDYGGLTTIRVPPSRLWKPDILMYNSADEDIDSTYPTNVVVSSDGSCLWVPPGLFLSTCKINIAYFPFDDQECPMKFGSWTYDGRQINLQLQAETGDISNFMPNGEWELVGMPAKRNVNKYDCCPEEYIDVNFTVLIRRRKLYYVFNLVVPCLFLSFLSLLVFAMPPDCGEKITMGVTILLSLTVFLLLVAETMPPTSDAVPLIGMYFACIMLMCSLSVVFTVLVLNYHHRTPDTHEMPRWVKKGICEWLAWALRMSRPGKDITRKKLLQNAKMRDLELRERSSKSLLANVLDLDDDFRIGANSTSNNCSRENYHSYSNHTTKLDDTYSGMSPARNDMKEILKELRFLTNKIKNDEEFEEQCNDWKFAAIVIDRLCLWAFLVFTVVSTCAILFSAPHIFS